MFALVLDLLNWRNPLVLLFAAFALWMLVDAIRREEYLWAVFIFIFPLLNAILYYFLVYRQAGSAARGFELPGTHDRRRIRELQDAIHHLDKAHHHSQLGDIYLQQGKLAKAEECYRAAMERDPEDLDTPAHYGQCLLRMQRVAEALPLLERVIRHQPEHDYGYSLMALAEAYTALERPTDAIAVWRQVLEQHTYARARVQLAELLAAAGHREEAIRELREIIADEAHAPAFQRRRDRVWIRRATARVRELERAR